jgi:hypothetical protein
MSDENPLFNSMFYIDGGLIDPRKTKLKLTESNPDQARDDHGRFASEGGAIASIAQRTIHGQGGSFSTHGEAAPTTGYMIADMGHERAIPLDASSVNQVESAIRSYAHDFKGPLLRKGVFLGTWLEHGQLFLDNSHNVQSRQDAFGFAHANKQLAVYNLDAGKAENTMSDGKRPGESQGHLTEAESDHLPVHKVFSNPATLDPHALAQALVEEFKSRGESKP